MRFFCFKFVLLIMLFLQGCTYLKYAALHQEYKKIQQADPSQVNLKHIIERDSFFVYGKISDKNNSYKGKPVFLAAFSDKLKKNELVDSAQIAKLNTHYGLHLPEGRYTLVAFVDFNKNNIFESSESVAKKLIDISEQKYPQFVVGKVDVNIGEKSSYSQNIKLPYSTPGVLEESVFYPSGSIRALDDPIFSSGFSTLGMYDPASFLEEATTMFYALEEDVAYKIPVVFVHGIGGSASDFAPIIEQIDREKYKPWFFHYPSGADLNQVSEMFHRIFLSGALASTGDMPVVVIAHSMGGLVVREALNLVSEGENRVELFISIATPFGGHEAAAKGEKRAPLVLPSWRDLNPLNPFISNLYRRSLPVYTNHHLLYAYKNDGKLKFGKNSDGVVSLESQLYAKAQSQALKQQGFNENHTDVLKSQNVIEYVFEAMKSAQSVFPDDHLEVMYRGGFGIELDDSYIPIIKYTIESYGIYIATMAAGELEPIDVSQKHFVDVVNGIRKPKTELENEWLRFVRENRLLLEKK